MCQDVAFIHALGCPWMLTWRSRIFLFWFGMQARRVISEKPSIATRMMGKAFSVLFHFKSFAGGFTRTAGPGSTGGQTGGPGRQTVGRSDGRAARGSVVTGVLSAGRGPGLNRT